MKFLLHTTLAFLPVFLLCIFAKFALGQELSVIAVKGYLAVSDEQVQDIYSRASYYFNKVHINFRVKFASVETNPCIRYHWLQFRVDELRCLEQLPRRKKTLTYYMTPPFIAVDKPVDQGGHQTAYVAGIARLGGWVATGNALETSLADGRNMLNESAVAMAHEVFHLLGATHQEGPNLMNPNANIYTPLYNGKLPVLRATKRQVARWYAKFGRRS